MENYTFKKIINDGKYGIIFALVVFSLSVFGYVETRASTHQNILHEFNMVSRDVIRQVEKRLDKISDITALGQSLYRSSIFVEKDEWDDLFLYQNIFEKNPGIQAIGYAERVFSYNKEAFVSNMASDNSDFTIKPDINKDEYYIIKYLVPLEGNESALGFDIGSETERLLALGRAIDTGEFSVTPPLSLMSSDASKPSFLGILPIYDNGKPSEILSERRENVIGLSASAFTAEDLFEDITKTVANAENVHFSIKDGNTFFDSAYRLDSCKTEQCFVDSHTGKTKLEYTKTIDIGGRKWEVEVHAHKEFFEKYRLPIAIPRILLSLGIIMGIFIFIIFFNMSVSKEESHRLAIEMRKKFEGEKIKVENINKELKKANTELGKTLQQSKRSEKATEEINKIMTGRELKMIEMKKEIEALKNKIQQQGR